MRGDGGRQSSGKDTKYSKIALTKSNVPTFEYQVKNKNSTCVCVCVSMSAHMHAYRGIPVCKRLERYVSQYCSCVTLILVL